MRDTVARFLPSFPNADRITIEQIVAHRSGIAHTNDLPWGDATQFLSLDEIVARLAETPLDFEPGAQRNYSNGGYAVLAKILEIVTGQAYPRLMRELVFDPLGMSDSGAIVDSRTPLPNSVRGYEPGDEIGERRAPRLYLPETRPGGGSLYASAGDVLRFFQAAARGRLEGSSAVPSLFSGNGAGGRSPGFYFDIHTDRAADLIVVSAGNIYAAEFRWAENIANLALGQEPLFSPPAVDLARALNEAWLGAYAWNDATVTLSRGAQRQLLLTAPDSAAVALIPLADGGYLDPMFFSICRLTSRDHIRCGRLYEGEGFVMDLDRRP
jgi:CubicO group peptidase (beta-lactamase class C family)